MSSVYDEALTMLAGTGPEYGDGLANTGPVVVDALAAMGRSYVVDLWVQGYLSRLEPKPASKQPVTRHNWRSALGDMARVSDWVTFFRRELRQEHWPVILEDWIPRLAPGLAGAAGHGFLRTAHAIRNIAIKESDLLKGELAIGLGYWAARFMKLPGIIGSESAGSLTPVEALSRIKWQHKKYPPRFKNTSAGLEGLSGFSPFAGVINLVAIPDEPLELISRITEVMARVLLSNSHDPAKVIPFIHALVVPGALRHVVPYVEREYAPILLRHGWQFAGALYAIYGRVNPVETCKQPDEDRDQLFDRAIATGNEFAIIFTVACLREFDRNPQPAYLAAAHEAVERLMRPSQDERESHGKQ